MAIIGTKFDIINFYNQQERNMFGDRTWQQARSVLDYQAQQASSQIAQQFGDEVAAAYEASRQQRASVLGSNLGIGAKDYMLKSLDKDIEAAYNSYLSEAYSAQQEVYANTQSLYDELDTLIESNAQNQLDLDEQIAAYYNFLVENYGDVLKEDLMFSKYLTDEVLVDADGKPILDEEGNIQYVTDEEGNIQKRFKTLQELDEVKAIGEFTDEFGVTHKEWGGFHDDQGNITLFGQDYYDLMLNYFSAHGGAPSFEDFLRKNYDDADEKTLAKREAVYEWMGSYNPYTLNDLEGNTQLGSFKTMVGLTSTDNTYQFLERFGGWSEEEVRGLFKDFNDKLTEISDWSNEDKRGRAMKSVEYIQDTVDQLSKIASDLGLSEEDLGFSWDAIKDGLEESKMGITTGEEQAQQVILSTVTGVMGGFVAGAAKGAIAGTSLLPGAGTAAGGLGGGGVGAIIGGLAGLSQGFLSISNKREQNKQIVESAQQAYTQIVTSMVQLAQAKHREMELGYENR